MWQVNVASAEQMTAMQQVMNRLQLDTIYQYATLANAKATVLKRLVQTEAQHQLLAQDGVRAADYLTDKTVLDAELINAAAMSLQKQMLASMQTDKEQLSLDFTDRQGAEANPHIMHYGDNSRPEILISGSDSVMRGSAFDVMSGVMAVDVEDGNLTAKLMVRGSVDTEQTGTYNLQYSVTDSGGQTSTAQPW